MYILGNTCFWKFLETCDPLRLDETVEALRSKISRVVGIDYVVEPADPEVIERWSKGSFNAPGEHKIKYPGLFYVCGRSGGNGSERWIFHICFTRIPHIKGIFSDRPNKHLLPESVERELSIRLIESYSADVFTRASDKASVGTAARLYIYLKLSNISELKNLADGSRYVPPGSDLRELLTRLSGIVEDGNSVMEIPTGRGQVS